MPQNLAACAILINGKGCECGPCGASGCCVAKLGQGPRAQSFGGIWGSGGCYPGVVDRNGCYTPADDSTGCKIAFTGSCECKMPCSEGITAKRGHARGSTNFPTTPCGSLVCSYWCRSGGPCCGKEEGAPCFCYSMGTK